MVKQSELVGFDPSTDDEDSPDYEAVILDFVRKSGCSYPAEIRRELGVSKDTVYTKLYRLEKDGFLKRHNLMGKTTAPDWIKPRLSELWGRGLKGDAITRMSWYTSTDADFKPSKDLYEHEQDYDNNMLALDAEMNRERGVEPSEKQLQAEKVFHDNP